MKKLALFGALLLAALWAPSCNKSSDIDSQFQADETLVLSIADASNKENVQPGELPAAALAYLREEYYDAFVEACLRVPDKGYEVTLNTEEVLYFDRNGRYLNHRIQRLMRRPCGSLDATNLIRPNALPQAILDYVSANYPGAQILRAKVRGEYILVQISRFQVLVFSRGTFEFVEEVFLWYDCYGCNAVQLAQLPQAVQDYITTNYPNGEVKRACRRNGRLVVGLLLPDGRAILVFDAEGNLIYSQP